MNLANLSKDIFTKFCQQGVSDRANFLKNIAVVGWVLSSLAQTCAIFFNDKLPSKEKRFLIPQEIFDGLINCTLFWFITSKATNLGKLLVLKKHVLPKTISKAMETFVPKGKDIAKLKESFLAHLNKKGNPSQIKVAKDAIEGLGVFSGIVGAIIATNIVTPILRNKLASNWQKKEMQKVADNAPLNPYFGYINPNNNVKTNTYPVTFKGSIYSSTNMKI